MKYLGSFWFIHLALGAVYAQSPEVTRVFLPVDPQTEKLQVVTSPRSSYVVKSAMARTDLQVIRFDTLLEEKWAVGLQRSLPNLSLVKAIKDRLFLLMSSSDERELDVLELDETTGHYFLTRFNFSKPFRLRDFVAYREHMWCSGSISGEPIACYLDASSRAVKALPIGFQSPILQVDNIYFDRERQLLGLTMRTMLEKHVVFLYRQVDLEGRIRRDQVFASPEGYNLDNFQYARGEDQEMAVASHYKGNQAQLRGLTVWRPDPAGRWSASDYPWREILGTDQRIDVRDELVVNKHKWDHGLSRSSILWTETKGLVYTIDRLNKEYNIRGVLQREQDQEILVNQLDQNQFGRRGFDVNESTLDDRVDAFSNTDIITYQFKDVLVGPLEEAGYAYAETWVFSLDDPGTLRAQIIRPSSSSFEGFTNSQSPVGLLQGSPVYFSADVDGLQLVDLERSELSTIRRPMGPYHLPWLEGSFLNFGFVNQERSVFLFLQRYDFAEWVAKSPE